MKPGGPLQDNSTRPTTEELIAPKRRWVPWVVALITTLAVGAAAGWAGAAVFRPADEVLDGTAYTLVEVVSGEVGSSVTLNTVAAWSPVPIGANLASGIVTSVNVTPGQEVGPGTVLYTVNLRPVVIAQGDVPAFRSLSLESVGADAAQLQRFLAGNGLYDGPIDGSFGPGTARAVKTWQDTLGVDADGVVQAGDIIFVPSLPIRVSLDTEAVARGASLGTGTAVLNGLPAAPAFTIPVTDTQSGLIASGTRVEIEGPGGENWIAYVKDRASGDDGSIIITLEGADGATICGDACAAIGVNGETLLPSRVLTAEAVSGLVIPSAAVVTSATGETFALDESGARIPIVIVASARGMSVVKGLSEGDSIRIPAASDN